MWRAGCQDGARGQSAGPESEMDPPHPEASVLPYTPPPASEAACLACCFLLPRLFDPLGPFRNSHFAFRPHLLFHASVPSLLGGRWVRGGCGCSQSPVPSWPSGPRPQQCERDLEAAHTSSQELDCWVFRNSVSWPLIKMKVHTPAVRLIMLKAKALNTRTPLLLNYLIAFYYCVCCRGSLGLPRVWRKLCAMTAAGRAGVCAASAGRCRHSGPRFSLCCRLTKVMRKVLTCR